MIRITSEHGIPLRALNAADQTVHFYDRYGFVSEGSRSNRQKMRRAVGLHTPVEVSRFDFRLLLQDGEMGVEALSGCTVDVEGSRLKLVTPAGLYFIEAAGADAAAESHAQSRDVDPRLWALLSLSIFVALVVGILNYLPTATEELKKVATIDALPVILKPTPPPVKEEVKDRIPPDPKLQAKKVVAKQLGFLGLLGRKDFRKAVGGLPTPAAQTTAGAGKGGTDGSGGELVAGMGRGLHQTTIGSTGMTGLGGIGTKGAGGGQGGYGDTAFGGVGSGTLSAIPLAQDAHVDEGLDRSQIQATIMRYLSQVRACYEEGLKRNQGLIGQVTMNFEINGGGALNFSRVQRSSLNDKPVEDCISTKMMNWKFPQPRGGVNVKVSYPFMLRPVKS